MLPYFWGGCPKDQQVLDLLALLRDAAKQVSEQAHVCSPEVQGSNSAVHFGAFFQGFELHSLTVPADKTIVDFHIFNQFFLSNELEGSLACFLPKLSTVSQTIPFTVWELRVLLELFPVVGFHAATLFSTVGEFAGTDNSGRTCWLLDINRHEWPETFMGIFTSADVAED